MNPRAPCLKLYLTSVYYFEMFNLSMLSLILWCPPLVGDKWADLSDATCWWIHTIATQYIKSSRISLPRTCSQCICSSKHTSCPSCGRTVSIHGEKRTSRKLNSFAGTLQTAAPKSTTKINNELKFFGISPYDLKGCKRWQLSLDQKCYVDRRVF